MILTNKQILRKRMFDFDGKEGPRVGDYLIRLDGSITRLTYDWGDAIQTGGHQYGQYYLGEGYLSYSGGLDKAVPKANMVLESGTKPGKVWFFDKDVHRAHNAVEFEVPMRIYKEVIK